MTKKNFYKHGIPNVSLTSPEHVRKKFDPLGLPNRLYVYFGFLATLLKIEISANFLKNSIFVIKKPICTFDAIKQQSIHELSMVPIDF